MRIIKLFFKKRHDHKNELLRSTNRVPGRVEAANTIGGTWVGRTTSGESCFISSTHVTIVVGEDYYHINRLVYHHKVVPSSPKLVINWF